jgi:hypothetical protein
MMRVVGGSHVKIAEIFNDIGLIYQKLKANDLANENF